MNEILYDAIKFRRSIYGISKEMTISESQLRAIIDHAVQFAPSAFNSQSARVILLLNKQHDKLWEITEEILRGIVPADRFAETEQKLNGFLAGFGTVLFFEEQNTVASLQESFPLYKDNFPIWSLESSGMLQYIIWMLLETEGLGASLQHYNPLIDERVKKEWNIPDSWKLLAQMPFGKPTAPAGEKGFLPLNERIQVFG